MADELSFIPMLERALQASDPKAALIEAFRSIHEQESVRGKRTGPTAFERFMDAAVRAAQGGQEPLAVEVSHIVRGLMVELATETFEGDDAMRRSATELIRSRPEWQTEYAALLAEVQGILDRGQLALTLVREGEEVITWQLDKGREPMSASGITPGHYALRLDTGRVVWQEVLTDRELVWTAAYPGQPLSVAAAQGQLSEQPTLIAKPLAGELALRVFPGLESGRIEIVSPDESGGV